jgi:multidrug efflux pump
MTIAIATVISTFNSLTLSPALSALLLKGHHHKPDALTRVMNFTLGWFFNGFNKLFGRATNGYEKGVTFSVRRKLLMMLVYGGLLGLTFYSFKIVPPGFVPAQDKQYLIGFAQLPQGATLDRTEEVIRKMGDIAMAQPGVASAVAFPGLSINGFVNSPSAGLVFVTLDDFKERDHHPDQNAGAIAGALMGQYMGIDDAFVAIFPPPPVMGLGTVGGFKLQIEDRTDQGYQALDNTLKAVLGAAWQNPALAGVFSAYNINSPQIFADLDRTKALQRGVAVQDVFSTMQVYLGSYYVNDFNQFGRTYQVIAQADRDYRGTAEDIARLQVRNATGEMVPLGALMDIKETFGPETAVRYNGFRSADVSGDAAPGFSSGQAQAAISQILEETLPPGMEFEWTDLTYQQILAGNSSVYIFPLCILFVFLILAALYESLTLPLAVIMIVPMSIMSALIGVKISGGDNNIFTQISLFVLAGLACKNAILIVEFARELEHRGRSIIDAAIEASRLRLRPILMTSFAFIMGVVPLVLSHGAGAEMRHAIGIAVFSGMLGVTLFGIFLTPVFYVLLRQLEAKLKGTTAMKWHDDTPSGH